MRRRLIEAAMLVFARQGIGASQIDDVMKQADVSRGGFYGHFRSMQELLEAIGTELGNETMSMIEQQVTRIADPAERIAIGLLLYLQCATSFPMFARFIAAAGGNVGNPHNLVYEFLPPHVAAGNDRGRLAVSDMEAAIDLLAGTMLVAVSRIALGPPSPGYCTAVVAGILMGLGATRATARRLAALPVPPIDAPQEGLLMRTHARQDTATPVPA